MTLLFDPTPWIFPLNRRIDPPASRLFRVSWRLFAEPWWNMALTFPSIVTRVLFSLRCHISFSPSRDQFLRVTLVTCGNRCARRFGFISQRNPCNASITRSKADRYRLETSSKDSTVQLSPRNVVSQFVCWMHYPGWGETAFSAKCGDFSSVITTTRFVSGSEISNRVFLRTNIT